MNETIFISVASYRDKDCPVTINSAFTKAKNPDRIFIGICQQNNENDIDCVDDKFEYKNNIRIIRLSHTDAKGPTYARYVCSTLYKNETYYMQVDSHMIFADDWDQKAIDMLKSIKSSRKPVLSYYPHNTSAKQNDKLVPRICQLRFNKKDIITAKATILTPTKEPTPGYLITGGTFFTYGYFINEVPFDPNLDDLFEGEEILFTARAWTNGWDIFTPNVNITYHYYERKDSPKFWSDKKLNSQKAEKKLKEILYENKDYGIYGLGNVRNIKDFFDKTGIDIVNKKSEKNLCNMESFALFNENNYIYYIIAACICILAYLVLRSVFFGQ